MDGLIDVINGLLFAIGTILAYTFTKERVDSKWHEPEKEPEKHEVKQDITTTEDVVHYENHFRPFMTREMVIGQIYEHMNNKNVFTEELMAVLMDMGTTIITDRDLLTMKDRIIIHSNGQRFELTENGLVNLDIAEFIEKGLASKDEIRQIIGI